jgi:cell wall-associated NlpC family hydrolase
MAFKGEAARFISEERFTSELGRFDEKSPFGKCRPTAEVDARSRAELLSKILKSDGKSRQTKQANKSVQTEQVQTGVPTKPAEKGMQSEIAQRNKPVEKPSKGMKQKSPGEKKHLKRQGAKTAVAKVIQTGKNLHQDFGTNPVTGDAMKDGKQGVVGAALHVINPTTYLKTWFLALLLPILPYIILFSTIGVLLGSCVFGIFSHVRSTSDSGEDADIAVPVITERDTGTFSNRKLTEAEINQLIEESGANPTQEAALRFALSKVGMPYSQPLRASGMAYDCSSLAYYAWKAAGVDLSNGTGYPPTAAAEAQFLSGQGRSVSELQPGDLVFYGKGGNGRFMDIYHVAIYIGNGKTAEAYNTKYGVIVESIRTKNLVLACRPAE